MLIGIVLFNIYVFFICYMILCRNEIKLCRKKGDKRIYKYDFLLYIILNLVFLKLLKFRDIKCIIINKDCGGNEIWEIWYIVYIYFNNYICI